MLKSEKTQRSEDGEPESPSVTETSAASQNNLWSFFCVFLIGDMTPLQPKAQEPQQPRSLPQHTRHLLHTPGTVELCDGRRQAADKSYISVCIRVERGGGGAVDRVRVPALAFVECLFIFPSFECVCFYCCTLCAAFVLSNKRVHWSAWKMEDCEAERSWILSFGGLTLARPPLANSRQQIRSWEPPTGPVTGT